MSTRKVNVGPRTITVEEVSPKCFRMNDGFGDLSIDNVVAVFELADKCISCESTSDELKEANRLIAELRNDIVAKNCCVHYKGMHENDYEDCMAVCDLHDDDYVSRDACAHCEDCELRH